MSYPGAIPSYAGFVPGDSLLTDNHAAQHNAEQADISALATKIGTGASTPASGLVLRSGGAGISAWGQVIMTSDVTGVLPTANGGTGNASLSFPSGAETVVGRAVSETLSNKTLTAPTIASFANANHDHTNSAGGGLLGSNSVNTSNIAADAVTAAKLLNGQLYRHQGSSATSLGAAGTTTYDLSATDVKIQTGSQNGNGNNSDTVVTFPIAFTDTPLILAAPYNSAGNYPTWYLVSQSTLGFTFRTGVNVASFCWIAIGT